MTTTTVTATYLDPAETACSGRVVFQLVAATYHDGLDAIFPTVPITAVLDDDGAISVELEPTSGVSADFDSTDMTYQVRERINGADRSVYYVDIPTASSVDLGTLTTYDDPPGSVRELVTPDLSTLGFATTEDVAAAVDPTWSRPASNRTVIIGDSITSANSNGELGRLGDQWFQHLCIQSLQRIRYAGYYGTSGYTLAQIRTNHLPSVLALDPAPGACVIAGGTNDVGPGLAWSFTNAKTALEGMVASLQAVGIAPILVQIPPRGDSAAANNNVAKWNAHIDRYAAQHGFAVVDMHTPLLDASNGGYLSGYDSGDDIHPSQIGHKAIAEYAIAKGLPDWFPVSGPLTSKWADPHNLIASGYGLFQSGSGIGTGWVTSGTSGSTPSFVTPSAADDLAGRWQQLSKPASASSTAFVQYVISSGFSVGDRVAFAARYQSEGIEGSDDTGVSVYTYATGSDPTGAYMGQYNWLTDVDDGLVYVEFTVPAATTALTVTMQIFNLDAGGPVIVRMGEMTVRNLTTMGLV